MGLAKNTPLPIALCGLGRMGQNHLRVLLALANECKLVAVIDPAAARREVAATQGVPTFADFDEALGVSGARAVVIASPTSTHADLATRAIERGVAVLVEKPIAETAEQGEQLKKLAEERNVPLMVGHIERFNPAIVALRQLVAEREVGDVINFTTRRVGGSPADVQAGNDVLIDLAVHDLDIAHWVTGADLSVVSALTYGDPVTCASALVRAGKTIMDMHVNWVTPTKIRKIDLTCTGGLIEVNLITQEVSLTQKNRLLVGHENDIEFTDYILAFSAPERVNIGIQRVEPLRRELSAFLQFVRGERDESPVTAADGIQALELALQVRRVGQSAPPSPPQ